MGSYKSDILDASGSDSEKPVPIGGKSAMQEIRLKTDHSEKAIAILRELMKTEESRLEYVLDIAQKRLASFENKYGTSSEVFLKEGAAEDLKGQIWNMSSGLGR